MKSKLATYTVLGGLTVAGLGAATLAYADPTATPSPAPSAGPQDPNQSDQGNQSQGQQGTGEKGHHRQGQGQDGGQLAKELATKLGLDETKVTDALKAVRQEMRPTDAQKQQGAKPDEAARQAEMAKKLAEKLGVDEAKVTTALNEIHAAQQAQHKAALKTRLDQAVKDGKLTQADADAVQKAADAGVIGTGRR